VGVVVVQGMGCEAYPLLARFYCCFKTSGSMRLDGDVDSWQSIRLYLMEQSCFFGYLLQRKGIYIRHGSRKCYMHLAGRPGGPGSTSSRCCESSDGPAYVVRCLLQLNTGPCSLQY
jgi:hypothetical protein